jgi:transposase
LTIAASTKVSLESKSLPRIAPKLAASQHVQIHDIIRCRRPTAEIADVAHCGIYRIKRNIRCFGSTKAPSNSVGRPRSITPEILDTLCEHLPEKPDLYHHEMVDFVWSHFQVYITISSIIRALKSYGWSKKKIGCIAKARNADLRDLYLYNCHSLEMTPLNQSLVAILQVSSCYIFGSSTPIWPMQVS